MTTAREGESLALPILCTDGSTLCRVRILTPAQWDALPPDQRPKRAEFVPALGWVVAVPVEELN